MPPGTDAPYGKVCVHDNDAIIGHNDAILVTRQMILVTWQCGIFEDSRVWRWPTERVVPKKSDFVRRKSIPARFSKLQAGCQRFES